MKTAGFKRSNIVSENLHIAKSPSASAEGPYI